ncbi:Gti1/Pac2 family-domain-containing protein, partial [Podospora didyma]
MSSNVHPSLQNQAIQNQALLPTWHGYVRTTMDALILFEACLSGQLSHVSRRPHDRERADLIISGNTFIYEEHASGIKRWTDGFNWSPSRILGNFLIYRELERAFAPGEKKKALKKKSTPAPKGGITKPSDNQQRSNTTALGAAAATADSPPNDEDRALVGSLVDSYPFKEGGLIKKTMCINWNGISHHLVSYYNIDDVKNHHLQRVTEDPRLAHIVPRSALISGGNFRTPVDQDDIF